MLRALSSRLSLPYPRGLVGRGGALLCALGLAACGPQGATPMPEPPSIDGGLIGPDREGISILSEPHPVPLAGSAGAVTPGAQVRVLNLDDAALPAVTSTAAADGSFQLTILATSGDELRVSALLSGQRSAPVDFLYTFELRDVLTQSPRHACVTLQPGFELELGAGRASVRFDNACAEPIQLAAPRFRTGTDFVLVTELPLVVAAGDSAVLELSPRSELPAAREDVWFTDVTLGSSLIRYPVGVFTAE